MDRLETVNGNGICDRPYLEKERVWRTFEDFEGTRIGGRKWWMGRGEKDKNHRGSEKIIGKGRRRGVQVMSGCKCSGQGVRKCGEEV